MNKTNIEWCDYTLNPVKGKCPMGCSFCYARRMYDRFHWNPEIRFDADVLWNFEVERPSRVFMGSTIELFGDWIPEEYLRAIFQWVGMAFNARHTFLFLTKCPQNLSKWGPFPGNCHVGITITNRVQAHNASHYLPIVEAKIKFISYEPLLDDVTQALYNFNNIYFNCNWLIIGQQTPVSKKTAPKIEWIQKIVETADQAGTPVFLKNNLKPLIQPLMKVPNMSWFGNVFGLRQELPNMTLVRSKCQQY